MSNNQAIGGAKMLARNLAFGLALIVPALLLGGAVFSQYVLGLHPCEMCYWQRWPHWAALAFALLGLMARKEGWADYLIYIAAIAIAISGLIGGFHAGVEYGWWEGVTSCATNIEAGSSQDMLDAIMNAPLIRCDKAPWTMFGISLAGYNFLLSIGTALTIWMLLKFAHVKTGGNHGKTI